MLRNSDAGWPSVLSLSLGDPQRAFVRTDDSTLQGIQKQNTCQAVMLSARHPRLSRRILLEVRRNLAQTAKTAITACWAVKKAKLCCGKKGAGRRAKRFKQPAIAVLRQMFRLRITR